MNMNKEIEFSSLDERERQQYAKVEHAIMEWYRDNNRTAGSLTRQIFHILEIGKAKPETARLDEPDPATGMIYHIFDQFEGYPGEVKIQVEYSGADNEEDIEFQWAIVRHYENEHLTLEQVEEINKILECGREEDYVRMLDHFYCTESNINFLHEYDK